MKIALLINRDNFEKYSNWGDTGWELQHCGNGEPDPGSVIATDADVLVVDAIMKIGDGIIANMPNLKLIHSQGVAYNAIDTAAASKSNIYVCNCAGVNARAVAEQAILLILALIKDFRRGEDMVFAGRQMEAKTARFKDGLPELGSMTVGIVGFGAIGSELSAMLKPFGCKINCYTRSGKKEGAGSVTFMPLNELYASSDIISLHVPVTGGTANMINPESLSKFRSGAILINTARGELVDHEAVADALQSGQLAGFGADTLAPEPVLPDNPLISRLPESLRYRVALSPHIAGITSGTFIRVYDRIRKNIEAIARGEKPDCVVNG